MRQQAQQFDLVIVNVLQQLKNGSAKSSQPVDQSD
jgi:hypothetical protein